MSMTATAPRTDEYAERWRQWQRGNAESSRRAAIRARIVFVLVLTAAVVWLGLQILYPVQS